MIVVDNGSTDGSAGALAEKWPRAVVVRNTANRGFAAANNQGYAASQGEMILLAGSDVEVREGALGAMVAYLDRHREAGAVACRLLNTDGTVQRSVRRLPRFRDALLTYCSLHRLARRYNMAGFDHTRTQEVEQPAATFVLLRRSVVDQTGLFDERYAILYNDVDLCRRIRAAGWKIVYVAEAAVTHRGCQTTRRAPLAVRLEMYRNILLYFRESAGRWAALCLMPVLLVRLLAVTRDLRAFRLLDGRGGKRPT